jgi:hypothetical protein
LRNKRAALLGGFLRSSRARIVGLQILFGEKVFNTAEEKFVEKTGGNSVTICKASGSALCTA